MQICVTQKKRWRWSHSTSDVRGDRGGHGGQSDVRVVHGAAFLLQVGRQDYSWSLRGASQQAPAAPRRTRRGPHGVRGAGEAARGDVRGRDGGRGRAGSCP